MNVIYNTRHQSWRDIYVDVLAVLMWLAFWPVDSCCTSCEIVKWVGCKCVRAALLLSHANGSCCYLRNIRTL